MRVCVCVYGASTTRRSYCNRWTKERNVAAWFIPSTHTHTDTKIHTLTYTHASLTRIGRVCVRVITHHNVNTTHTHTQYRGVIIRREVYFPLVVCARSPLVLVGPRVPDVPLARSSADVSSCTGGTRHDDQSRLTSASVRACSIR